MRDTLQPWRRLLRTASDATSVETLGRALVDGVAALGAGSVATWSRVGQGQWHVVAATGRPPPTPPDGVGWHVLSCRTSHRTVALAWDEATFDDTTVGMFEAILDGAVRRLDALATAEAATQSGSQRLATVMDASPDAVLVVDPRGRIVHANARAADLFGYALDELVNHGIDQLVPDDVRTQHAALRAGYAEAPTQRAMAAGQDLRARHRDGSEFHVDIALTPIEAEGQPAFAAFVRDATARHRAEQQRHQLRDAERARNQALELNDNVVQGLTSSVWLMEMDDVPEALHAARRTLASARGMMRDLLDHNQTSIVPGRLQRSHPVPSSGLQPHEADAIPRVTTPLRVVVADDSEDIRLLLDVRLRAVPDIELVAVASDGIEAVEAVDEHRPDVVLMDLSMPRLDGLEATSQVRARHPDVRVVVLTGHPRSTVEAEALAAGAEAVVEKGGSFDLLLQLMRGKGAG